MPSCKFIIINCVCNPKLYFILFIVMGHFDSSFAKNHDTFLICSEHVLHFILPIWDYGGVILRNILNAHFAPLHCLSTTRFITTIIFMKNIQLDTIYFYKSLSNYCTFFHIN
jgi:hypothetical protein